jgi:hypothetical protein
LDGLAAQHAAQFDGWTSSQLTLQPTDGTWEAFASVLDIATKLYVSTQLQEAHAQLFDGTWVSTRGISEIKLQESASYGEHTNATQQNVRSSELTTTKPLQSAEENFGISDLYKEKKVIADNKL